MSRGAYPADLRVTLSCGHEKFYPIRWLYLADTRPGASAPCWSSCDHVPSGGKQRTIKTVERLAKHVQIRI